MRDVVGKVAALAALVSLAIPTWWFVVVSAAAPRTSDNGVFLSVAAAVADGAPLYVGVVDNKDPLFYYALAGALKFGPGAAQLLDAFWLLLAAIGGWLMSRSVTRPMLALFVGFVCTPLVILGIAYQPGMTNIPGTALVMLGMGLLVTRVWWMSGALLALAVAAKITVVPIAIGVLAASLLVPQMRARASRSFVVFLGSLVVVAGALWVVGSIGGYVKVVADNLRYSGDVLVYFGLSPDLLGHLERLEFDMSAGRWITAISILIVAGVAAGLWRFRSEELKVLSVWLWIAIVGTLASLGFTYVWPHHWQVLALPAGLALVVSVGLTVQLLDGRRGGFLLPWVTAMALILPLGGWIPIERITTSFQAERAEWPQWRSDLAGRPLESKLLETVPLSEFTVARLGTNDSASFLLNLPEEASLACPRFHLYDFSPIEHFDDALDCLKQVDVVIVTDQFLNFQNGWRSASVAPLVSEISASFMCLRLEDRQVCSRL